MCVKTTKHFPNWHIMIDLVETHTCIPTESWRCAQGGNICVRVCVCLSVGLCLFVCPACVSWMHMPARIPLYRSFMYFLVTVRGFSARIFLLARAGLRLLCSLVRSCCLVLLCIPCFACFALVGSWEHVLWGCRLVGCMVVSNLHILLF